MNEGDDEDLWLKCLDTAYDVLAKVKHPRTPGPYYAFANALYKQVKATTAKDIASKPKTVVQLKGV